MEKPLNSTPHEIDAQAITLKDIVRKISRARVWIFYSTLISLLATIYVTYSTPPVYESTASVMIETSNKAQKIFNYNLTDDVRISDEVSVIKSRTIAEDAIKSLWNSNKRNSLYVLGTKVFMPRGQRLRRPIKKIFTLGKWTPENQKAPQYYESYNDNIGAKYFGNILSSITVYAKRGTNIINITASSPHPHEAAMIANTVAVVYKNRDKEWSSNESLNIKSFLMERLTEKEKEIEDIDDKIKKYKLENQIYDIGAHGLDVGNNLKSMENEYENNKVEINVAKEQQLYLEKQLSTIETNFAIKMLNSLNAQLFALRNQVNEKEAELVKNSTVYGSKHEAVIKIKQDLTNLKNQLGHKTNELISDSLSIVDPLQYRQELISELIQGETRLHQLETKSKEYKLLILQYEEEMQILPEKESYLGKLFREKNVLSNTYSYMRQKMEEARVSMASEPGKVRILNRAEKPNKPVSPDVIRNILMSIIIGVMIGIGIGFFIEYFDNSVRSLEYIERKNLPVLAIIPSIGDEGVSYKGKARGKNKANVLLGKKAIGNIKRRLVTYEDPKSPISEAYRGLRTSLMYTKKGAQGSIMVSSPGPGEGKTTTIINLAITYANLRKKTLLIDADLRKPVLHNVFDSKIEKGLTHYLSGVETKLKSIIYKSDINNLDIIFNGAIPPNPSELLGSELMKELVEELKDKYDVVLFDAPPILAVTDAVVLSRLVDQFLMVIRFGNTDKDSIDQAIMSLAHVDTTLTGVVFNDLNRHNSYYSKGYSYYYYNQYYYTSDRSKNT